MHKPFKKLFIFVIKYLPILYCTVISLFCCNKLFALDIVIYPASLQTLCLLLCLSFIFKYCLYHKILLLFSISFWVLYELHIVFYGIFALYLFMYIILLLYGIKNKM